MPEVNGWQCPACKTVNPKEAKHCMNCGSWLLDTIHEAKPVVGAAQPDKKKASTKRKLGYGCLSIIAIVIIIIIIAAANSHPGTNTASAPGSPAGSNNSQTVALPKIGQKATSGSYALSVNKVEVGANYEWVHPQPGNKFVIVDVTIQNNGSSNINYNEWNFKIQDSDGNITQPSMTGIGAYIKRLNSGELIPGGKVSGSVPFEIASESKPVMLIWETGLLTGKITVDLR